MSALSHIPRPEAVYMIQEREFLQAGEPVYKIGRTCQEGLKRLSQYPKGSALLLHSACRDCRALEAQIKTLFKAKYVQERAYGVEYFRGDAAAMAADINRLVAAEAKRALAEAAEAKRALAKAAEAKRALAEARAYVYVDTDAPESVPMDVVEDSS